MMSRPLADAGGGDRRKWNGTADLITTIHEAELDRLVSLRLGGSGACLVSNDSAVLVGSGDASVEP
jgi:hypothetical protein